MTSRRALLLGAAGTGLALPFLPSFRGSSGGGVLSQLIGGRARADSAAPKRVVIWLGSYGATPNLWDPLNTNADGTRWDMNHIMEPLSEFKDRMTVLSGINMASVFRQEGRQGNHTIGYTNVLSSAGRHDEFPWGPDTALTKPNGPSIDQVIADAVGGSSRFPSLVIGDNTEHLDQFVQRADGSTPDLLTWPDQLFDRVFREFAGDSSTRARTLLARRSMLDAVLPGYASLRGRVNAEDARTIDAHLTSLRDMERRFGTDLGACSVPSEPLRTGSDAGGGPTYADPRGPYEPLLDLAARTLVCDQTRIMTVRFGGRHAQVPAILPNFNELNRDGRGVGDLHSYSHSHWGDPQGVNIWVAIQRWRLSLFANFLRTLDSVPDVDGGTLLDNTVVVHISEIMTGLHDGMPLHQWGYSNPEDTSSPYRPKGLPCFYVGGCGGQLRTGLHLDLSRGDTYGEQLGKYSTGELWLTIARAMGVSAEQLPTFGNPDVCRRIISEMMVG